jgi:hypothetical protein
MEAWIHWLDALLVKNRSLQADLFEGSANEMQNGNFKISV